MVAGSIGPLRSARPTWHGRLLQEGLLCPWTSLLATPCKSSTFENCPQLHVLLRSAHVPFPRVYAVRTGARRSLTRSTDMGTKQPKTVELRCHVCNCDTQHKLLHNERTDGENPPTSENEGKPVWWSIVSDVFQCLGCR